MAAVDVKTDKKSNIWILEKIKGGPGSGHHGHSGRPGHRGGSLPGSGLDFSALRGREYIDKKERLAGIFSHLEDERRMILERYGSSSTSDQAKRRWNEFFQKQKETYSEAKELNASLDEIEQETITAVSDWLQGQRVGPAYSPKIKMRQSRSQIVRAEIGGDADKKEVHEGIDPVLACLSDRGFPNSISILFQNIGGAAWYNPDDNTIHNGWTEISSRCTRRRLMIHELGHWIEANAPPFGVASRVNDFFVHRVSGQPDSTRFRFPCKPDRFIEPYSGRYYRNQYGGLSTTEVFSTGLEYLFTEPERFYREDPETFNLVVDIVTGK